jgi:hypothetical protein
VTQTQRRLLILAGAVIFCGVAFHLAQTRTFEFGIASWFRGMLDSMPPPARARLTAVLSHLPVDEDPAAWMVRKAASIVFFGAFGAMSRFIAGDRFSTAAGSAWLVIGSAVGISAAIEIFEYPESAREIAFDLACGLAGGLLAFGLLRLFRRRGI